MAVTPISKSWLSGDTFLATDVDTILKGTINNVITHQDSDHTLVLQNAVDIGLLDIRIDDNDVDITNLQSSVTTNINDISTLSGETGQIAINTSNISTVSGQTSTNTTNITNIETQQSTNTGNISDNSSDITTLYGLTGDTYWEEDGSVNHIVTKAGITHTKVNYLNLTLSSGTPNKNLAIDASGNVIEATAVGYWVSGGTASVTVLGAGGTNTGDYSVGGGYQPDITSSNSVAIGYRPDCFGNASAAFNFQTTAQGNYSFASGYGTNASGSTSFAGGQYTQAKGSKSFNFSTATAAGDSIVNGISSAILGGLDNNIGSYNYSVVLGGQNITATASDTVYAPKLETMENGEGVVMRSPDGTAYKLTIANGGTVTVTAV